MATLTAPPPSTLDSPIAVRLQDGTTQTRSTNVVSEQVAAKPRPMVRAPEEAAERAKIRTVLAIVALVVVAGMVLAMFLLPADMVIVGGTGIALTFLLFGIPFWISAIDEAAEQASTRARADQHRGKRAVQIVD